MKNRILDSISVATPCEADWGSMTGDEAVRFCAHCAKNVYHLSEMTEAEAMALISERESNLCVRFYRRPDGSIVTRDCTPIWRRAGQRAHRAAATLLSALAVFSPMAWAQQAGQSSGLVQIQGSGTALVGKVTDIVEAPIPNALIVITHAAGNKRVEARTNADGTFRVDPLPSGNYKVEISAAGFEQQSAAVRFAGQPEERMELALKIGRATMGDVVFVDNSKNAAQSNTKAPKKAKRNR